MQKKIRVQIEKGVHARTAALISGAAGNINREFSTEIFIRKGMTSVPATSMLALNYLKIKNQDEIELHIEGDRAQEAMEAMEKLFVSEDNLRITDLESFDKVLEANSKRSEFIIDQMTSGLLYLNKKGLVILVNEAAENIMGIKRSEILGQFPDERFGKELQDILLSEEEFEGRKFQYLDKYLECSKKHTIIDSGRGTVVTLRDVSAMVSLSSDLVNAKAIHERLGMVLDQMTDGMIITDKHGNIQYANKRAMHFFDMSPTQLGEKLDKDKFPILIEAIKTQEFFSNKIIKLDKEIKLAVSVSGLDHEESYSGAICVFTELSGMRELIDKLDAAEKKVQNLEKKLELASPLHTAFECLIGESRALDEALRIASRVANTKTTVLVTGESGTGKELFAKAIHEASPRSGGPFIRVNCAAIPDALIESELFGHEKGSFTGAIHQRIGKFEQAHGGTIFLDEIGEVPLQTQVKLLRVLQEFEVDRVGGSKPVNIDVRVIAATNKDLLTLIAEKKFREDLYYRLNVIPIHLPPLRDRMGDIPLLVNYFLNKIAVREQMDKKHMTPEALQYLEAYQWPGNIRELENTLIRAATLSIGDRIEVDVLPPAITKVEKINGLIRLVQGEVLALEVYEKEIIKEALRIHGSFNKAGKALGLTHRTVGLKAKKYGLID